MSRIPYALLACLPFFYNSTLAAIAGPVDWKYYGGTASDLCFYDADTVRVLSPGLMKVWVKCLRKVDLTKVDIKKEFGGRILESTAQKVAEGYIPPLARLENGTRDEAITVTQYESTANIGNLTSAATILYELDCTERRNRELSIQVRTKNKIGSSDRPSDWHNVPPEGNGAKLLSLLCRGL